MVDFVSSEAKKAGQWATLYTQHKIKEEKKLYQEALTGVSYVLPTIIHVGCQSDIECLFRVTKPYKACKVVISSGDFYKEVKKRSMVPAEMEKVVLKKSELAQIHENICWEVIEC